MSSFLHRAMTSGRAGSTLDRVEALYLRVLRTTVLIVATILLIWAVCWAVLSLSRVARSPDSVVEAQSVVSADELLQNTSGPATRGAAETGPQNSPEQRAFYDDFVKGYYALYKSRYEPHLRREDKRLNQGEFDDLTIDTTARLRAIREGQLDFATDQDDLNTYLPVLTQASEAPSMVDRLARYRSAVKRRLVTRVQRTRTENRRGWDSLSTSCSLWYESPVGCAVTRRVEVPYTQQVAVMRYPDGISSPGDILKSSQDRYFELLAERRAASAAKATAERDEITFGQAKGWSGLYQAVLVAAGFLVLMFFFLLVAIERHQRRLSNDRHPASAEQA